MSESVDKAWDALPPQQEADGATWDPTPEAAALRSLFGQSPHRLVGNSGAVEGDRERDAAAAIQEHIAQNYLFAIEAHRGTQILEARYRQFVALRDELLAADMCLACGTHTPGRSCQCENDE